MLTLVGCFMITEFSVGLIAGSLALLADSFHMMSDASALIVAIIGRRLSKRGRTNQYTFGFRRAETIGGLVNSVFLISTALFIITEAISRFLSISEVTDPLQVIIVASCGFVINVFGTILLGSHGHGHSHGGHGHSHNASEEKGEHSHHKVSTNVNIKAVLFHAVGDAVGSLCALTSGLLIKFLTQSWRFYFDPILS